MASVCSRLAKLRIAGCEDTLMGVQIAVVLSADCWPSALKRLIHLPGTFDILSVQADGRGGNGCMPQVVPDGRQLGTQRQCKCGMGVAHPMWACSAQFFRSGWALLLDDIGDLQEKPLCDAPQPRRRDAAGPILFVTADERYRGVPRANASRATRAEPGNGPMLPASSKARRPCAISRLFRPGATSGHHGRPL